MACRRTRRAEPVGLPHVVHLDTRSEDLDAVEQLDVVQDFSFFPLQSTDKFPYIIVYVTLPQINVLVCCFGEIIYRVFEKEFAKFCV